jgi:hypothetical protein
MGTLELYWTIDGVADPAACDALGAIEFEALFSDGFAVSGLHAPCGDFADTATLYVDDYVVRTRLVSDTNFSATRRIVLDQVRILEDQVTTLSIDFPSELIAAPRPEGDAGIPPEEAEPDAGLPPAEEPAGDAGVPPDATPTDAGATPTDAGAT